MKTRKQYILILFAICMWLPVQGITLTPENPDSIRLKELRLLSADTLIRTPAVGRFDRGITNHRFAPKKQWMGGLTISYTNFDSKDSRLLILIKNLDCYGYTVKVNPYVGYFYRDNSAVGLKMGYERSLVRLDNASIKIDDLDISLKDIYMVSDLFSGTVFHRSYVGLDAGKRIALFNESSLTVSMGNSRFDRGKNDALKAVETSIYEMQLGISPGVSVFIMDKVSTEVSFGILGLKYRKETQKTNNVETGSWRDSGANFKINVFNINIGITVYI